MPRRQQPTSPSHDFRDITDCTPGFIEALGKEPMSMECPAPLCVDGIKTIPMLSVHDTPTRVIGVRSDGPCETCLGRGWLYVACGN